MTTVILTNIMIRNVIDGWVCLKAEDAVPYHTKRRFFGFCVCCPEQYTQCKTQLKSHDWRLVNERAILSSSF